MAKAKAKVQPDPLPDQDGPGPDPGADQHHKWATEAEYEAQLALPVHLVGAKVVTNDAGLPCYLTLCGVELGTRLLRTSDIRADVTCQACRKKRVR